MSEERFDPGLKYIGTGEYVPVMEWSAEGEYVRHSCIANLEKKLAERDAALARCVDVIDVEPELPGDIPDEIWYRLKLQVDAGDRLGVSGTLRGVVRATKKAIRQRVALSIPASTQATAKVLAAARDHYEWNNGTDDDGSVYECHCKVCEAIREEKETK